MYIYIYIYIYIWLLNFNRWQKNPELKVSIYKDFCFEQCKKKKNPFNAAEKYFNVYSINQH